MAQIGCNLTEEEAEDLNRYAAAMELSRPCVCALLVHRELRRPRLKKLKATCPEPFGTGPLKRVTVRIDNPDLKEAFAVHVAGCGMGSDEAAAILFRTEIKEKWVLNSLSWSANRS